MTFSIVIPSYNGSQFITQAIDSAINQTRPADEIIVSDDNSSDETLDICKKYGNKIKLFKNIEGPSGFVNGWNNSIAHASSDFISLLHQDDILDPTFLEEAEKALNEHPHVKHLFSVCKYIDGKNRIIGTSYQNNTPNNVIFYSGKEYMESFRDIGNPHIHRCPGVITHKSIFERCKYRSEAGHIADNDFFFRVGQFTDVIGLLSPLSSYRIHELSETGHLKNKILVKRLLKDYHFQMKHLSENIFADKPHYNYFRKNKNKYLKNLLGYALKEMNLKDVLYAIRFLL